MTAILRIRNGALITLVAALTIVPLSLLVLLPLNMSTAALMEEAQERVTAVAKSNAVTVQRQLDASAKVTEAAATSPVLVNAAGLEPVDELSPVTQRLAELKASNPDIVTAALVNSAGKVIARYPWEAELVGTDVSQRPYFQKAQSNGTSQLSSLFVAQTDQRSVVAIARSVETPEDGQRAGVVVSVLDVQRTFQSWVDEVQQRDAIGFTILDADNGVIARPGTTLVGEQLSHSEPIGTTGWRLAASVSLDEALTPAEQLQDQVLATAAVLVTMLGLCVIVLSWAVRARSRAEKSLHQAEQRIHSVLQTASQIYMELDSDGRITEWNKTAETVLGWRRDEIVGAKVFDTVVVPDRISIANALIERLGRTGTAEYWSSQQDTKLNRKNVSEPVEVEMTVWTTPVGSSVRLSLLAQVITERKRSENERELLFKHQQRLVEELQEADRSKSDFVSTVSHELRTPLTSIIGYSEMLGEGFGGELTSQQSSMLDVVDRNSRRLLSLIEDLLILSRIDAGKLRMNAIDVDVSQLVTHAVQSIVPSASDKHLEFQVDIAPGTGAVSGDPVQLERVLLNLISNAIKFTPEHGRIAVRAYRDGDDVQLSVQDSGMGIPVEEQARLGQRFFRSARAVDEAIPGTGLGLAIVHSIVKRHNGTVTVQSAPGTGTTVLVKLPSAEQLAPSR